MSGSRIATWTTAAARDLAYSAAICVWGACAFTILVSGATVTASLLPLAVGVFAWVGFVHLVRWTTWVDRGLAGWRRREPVRAAYRIPRTSGLLPFLKTLTTDPQTWRDLAWLAVTSVAGFGLGLAVLTLLGAALAYVTMPLWFWAVTDPAAQNGLTNLGVATIDTWQESLAVCGLGILLIPLVLLLARGCAAAHAGLAVRLLGPRSPA